MLTLESIKGLRKFQASWQKPVIDLPSHKSDNLTETTELLVSVALELQVDEKGNRKLVLVK